MKRRAQLTSHGLYSHGSMKRQAQLTSYGLYSYGSMERQAQLTAGQPLPAPLGRTRVPVSSKCIYVAMANRVMTYIKLWPVQWHGRLDGLTCLCHHQCVFATWVRMRWRHSDVCVDMRGDTRPCPLDVCVNKYVDTCRPVPARGRSRVPCRSN